MLWRFEFVVRGFSGYIGFSLWMILEVVLILIILNRGFEMWCSRGWCWKVELVDFFLLNFTSPRRWFLFRTLLGGSFLFSWSWPFRETIFGNYLVMPLPRRIFQKTPFGEGILVQTKFEVSLLYRFSSYHTLGEDFLKNLKIVFSKKSKNQKLPLE